MKKLSLYCILALLCASLIFAQSTSTYVAPGGTWIWPLGADETGQPVGEVVIRPGNVENPVHGNVFWNPDYYISADEGTPIYAPVDGMVTRVFSNVSLPDGKGVYGIHPDDPVEVLAEKKKLNPLVTLENASKDLVITMNDGKTLYLRGFLDISVNKRENVARGQQIGTLGYNPTFYKDPSIKVSLATKAGRVDTELGLDLLGEDNSRFFSNLRRDISYRPEKVLTKEEFLEDWNIFKFSLLEDHPALIDPLVATKVQQKIAEIDILLNDMETVRIHDFYLFATEVLATAHCVHTPLTWIDAEYSFPISPLQLVLHEGQCFVVWDRRGNNEIPTGTEVLAVNGVPIKELAQKLERFVTTDTMNPEVAQIQLENDFTDLLQSYFLNDSYSFTLVDNTIVELPSLSSEQVVSVPVIEQSPYEQVNEDTAVLHIESMDDLKDREPWIAYFKEISESGTKNFIVDLRGNSGGSNYDVAFLLSYFLEQPFQLNEYDEIKHDNMDDDEFQIPTDGAYKSINKQVFEPAKTYGFKGNLYVLVDTFSASNAVNTARILADNGAVTIGTETRGGYYSTNAGTFTEALLFQTNLTLKMPITRVVFTTDESSGNPPNSGLIPQYIVYKTLDEKLYSSKASDSQLNYTLELIKDIELVKTQELQKAQELIKSQEQKRIALMALAVVLVLGIPVAVLVIKKRRKAVK